METESFDRLAVRQLVLVNDNGQPRLRIGCNTNGDAALHFLDEEGRVKLSLGAQQNGEAALQLVYPATGALFAVTLEDGIPVINLVGSDQRGKITMEVSEAGQPQITLSDREGAVRCYLRLNEQGEPELQGLASPPNP